MYVEKKPMLQESSHINERRNRGRVQALVRADLLLTILAKSGDWMPLGKIAQAAGLNKSTAFNLLDTLVMLGFAERDSALGRYRLGLRNLELGRLVQGRLGIIDASEGALLRLCASTRETVNLAVPRVLDLLIVSSMEGGQGVRVTSYAGTRALFHSTACGKAMLAFMPAHFLEGYLDQPLAPATAHTLTDPDALKRDLELVRARGYAVELEENELGAGCVGAPIFDGFGAVVGAISVAGPITRMTEPSIDRIAEVLAAETAAVSHRLGYKDEVMP
jgi:DNA-binding IclR family transcriptional regulator